MPLYETLLPLAQATGGQNPMTMLVPLILIFVVFYFFIIRPQRKKDAQRKQMIAAVRKGDKIITLGGVHASVTQVDETSVLVQADSNVKLRIEKSAIASVDTKG